MADRSRGKPPPVPSTRNELESSIALLRRARSGDRAALESLFERYRSRLRRWATGRLPRSARGLLDTEDLVQETLLKTLERVDRFEPRGEGAVQAYLRQALHNRIVDERRRASRAPRLASLPDTKMDAAASPLEEAIGREALDRYDAALERLEETDREAIVARVELGFNYDEVARALGKPSRDAARMAVSRALVRLAKVMQ